MLPLVCCPKVRHRLWQILSKSFLLPENLLLKDSIPCKRTFVPRPACSSMSLRKKSRLSEIRPMACPWLCTPLTGNPAITWSYRKMRFLPAFMWLLTVFRESKSAMSRFNRAMIFMIGWGNRSTSTPAPWWWIMSIFSPATD